MVLNAQLRSLNAKLADVEHELFAAAWRSDLGKVRFEGSVTRYRARRAEIDYARATT